LRSPTWCCLTIVDPAHQTGGACDATAVPDTITEVVAPDAGVTYSWGGTQYHYNWSTKGLTSGEYRIRSSRCSSTSGGGRPGAPLARLAPVRRPRLLLRVAGGLVFLLEELDRRAHVAQLFA
jgi:hypothetical protein